MTLIKSISGFRGTIGGRPLENLTPVDAVSFAAAYGQWVRSQHQMSRPKIVIGRDARISGLMIQELVMQTLVGMGIDVINLGLSTTPTVEVMVPIEHAQGGIILTASHNPKQWNALKLLNEKGEFVNAEEGQAILAFAEAASFEFATVDNLGRITTREDAIKMHINEILNLPLVNKRAIASKNFKVVVDGVCSTGGIAVPALLKDLGVEVVQLYCEPTGHFPHNPEPLEAHLTDLMAEVKRSGAHFGLVVDPDVDRLAFIDEHGAMFGEEYTLVAVADYVLSKTPGNTVSNLSSSRALQDITKTHGCHYTASAVGEVNVVTAMKATNAVIGGEGNGGIIYPALHFGRDSLVGIALFLSFLAETELTVSALKQKYPAYFMSKMKLNLEQGMDVDALLNRVTELYVNEEVTTVDGVKIDFAQSWVHLRKSNTEPIIRVYTEANSQKEADKLASKFVEDLKQLAGL